MDKITEKIKRELRDQKPKPVWEIKMWRSLIDLVLVLMALIAIATIGVIIYVVQELDPWEGLPNGFLQQMEALKTLPWELLAVVILLLVLIYFIARKINFLYRLNPWMLLGIIALVVGVGYLTAEYSGANEKLAQTNILKPLYGQEGRFVFVKRGAVLIGEVHGIEPPHITIQDNFGHVWQVNVRPETKIVTDDGLFVDDMIKVNGIKVDDKNFDAFLIQKLKECWRGICEKFQQFKITVPPPPPIMH